MVSAGVGNYYHGFDAITGPDSAGTDDHAIAWWTDNVFAIVYRTYESPNIPGPNVLNYYSLRLRLVEVGAGANLTVGPVHILWEAFPGTTGHAYGPTGALAVRVSDTALLVLWGMHYAGVQDLDNPAPSGRAWEWSATFTRSGLTLVPTQAPTPMRAVTSAAELHPCSAVVMGDDRLLVAWSRWQESAGLGYPFSQDSSSSVQWQLYDVTVDPYQLVDSFAFTTNRRTERIPAIANNIDAWFMARWNTGWHSHRFTLTDRSTMDNQIGGAPSFDELDSHSIVDMATLRWVSATEADVTFLADDGDLITFNVDFNSILPATHVGTTNAYADFPYSNDPYFLEVTALATLASTGTIAVVRSGEGAYDPDTDDLDANYHRLATYPLDAAGQGVESGAAIAKTPTERTPGWVTFYFSDQFQVAAGSPTGRVLVARSEDAFSIGGGDELFPGSLLGFVLRVCPQRGVAVTAAPAVRVRTVGARTVRDDPFSPLAGTTQPVAQVRSALLDCEERGVTTSQDPTVRVRANPRKRR